MNKIDYSIIWDQFNYSSIISFTTPSIFLNDLIMELFKRSDYNNNYKYVNSYWHRQIEIKKRIVIKKEKYSKIPKTNLLNYYQKYNKEYKNQIDLFILKLKEEKLSITKEIINNTNQNYIALDNDIINTHNNIQNTFLKHFIKNNGLMFCASVLLGPYYKQSWEFLLQFIVNVLIYSIQNRNELPIDYSIDDIFKLSNSSSSFLQILWDQLNSLPISSMNFQQNIAILWRYILGLCDINYIHFIYKSYLCEVLLKPLYLPAQNEDTNIPKSLNTLMDAYNTPKTVFTTKSVTKEGFIMNWFFCPYANIINSIVKLSKTNDTSINIYISCLLEILNLFISITSQSITGRYLSWLLYFWVPNNSICQNDSSLSFYWINYILLKLKYFPNHKQRILYSSLCTLQLNCLKYLRVNQKSLYVFSINKSQQTEINKSKYYKSLGLLQAFPSYEFMNDFFQKNIYIPHISLQYLSINDYLLRNFILAKIHVSSSIWKDLINDFPNNLIEIKNFQLSKKVDNMKSRNIFSFSIKSVKQLFYYSTKKSKQTQPSSFLLLMKLYDNSKISNFITVEYLYHKKNKLSYTVFCQVEGDFEDYSKIKGFNTLYATNPALIASYKMHQAVHSLVLESTKTKIFPSWLSKVLSGKLSTISIEKLSQVFSESKLWLDSPDTKFFLPSSITTQVIDEFLNTNVQNHKSNNTTSYHKDSEICENCSLILDNIYSNDIEETLSYKIFLKCKNICNSSLLSSQGSSPGACVTFFDSKNNPLYKAQQHAVLSALFKRITLIVGPPGTGKTTVTSQIVNVLYKNYFIECPSYYNPKKILVLAQSNNAIDQILEKLVSYSLPIFRLGSQTSSNTAAKYTHKGYIEYFTGEINTLITFISNILTDDSKLYPLLDDINTIRKDKTINYSKCYNILNAYITNKFSPKFNSVNKQIEKEGKSNEILLECLYSLGIKFEVNTNLENLLNILSKYLHKLAYLFNILSKDKNEQLHSILNSIGIVIATCSGFAMQINNIKATEFDTIIIEEAGKVLESECIFTFSSSLKRLILVGDDQQMRSLVFYNTLKQNAFDQSLMVRFQRLGIPHIQLNEQTRAISFIANLYRWRYNNLIDHQITNRITPINYFKSSVLCVNIKPISNNTNETNPAEYLAIMKFIKHLDSLSISYNTITILTPYRKQQNFIHSQLLDNNITSIIVNTIDEYQGKENDIIIISTCFTGNSPSSFLCDERRINVLTSRARILFVLFGNIKRLENSSSWKKIIDEIANTQQLQCKLRNITPIQSFNYIEYCKSKEKTWEKICF